MTTPEERGRFARLIALAKKGRPPSGQANGPRLIAAAVENARRQAQMDAMLEANPTPSEP